MQLHFYNTLSRKKEIFEPIDNDEVGIYTCGPTVYNFVHLGNLRTFMFEDLLVRYLRFSGYEVKHVMNLTDVDDKTIKGSIEGKIPLNDYTRKYKEAFFNDVQKLNMKKADVYPAATDHIQEMVDIIKTLLRKELAYLAEDGSVYFSIRKFKNYGQLSGLKLDELKNDASGRLNQDEYSKDDAKDFVLWKAWDSNDEDVFWDTEIGKGRPGWHLECSAMSVKYLGESFDIHCGGVDNAFPHHENEIAQSEGVSGKKFVNYWLHSEFLMVEGKKMAKSEGNFFILKDLLDKGYSPMAIRYALITTHYRQQLNFSNALIGHSDAALKRISEFVNNISQIKKDGRKENLKNIIEEAKANFINHMNDDLNISPALAAIFDFIKKVNTIMADLGRDDAYSILKFLKEINEVLGFIEFKADNLEEEIVALIKEREQVRKEKNFKRSDEIRDLLLEKGVKIKDTKEGTVWEKI